MDKELKKVVKRQSTTDAECRVRENAWKLADWDTEPVQIEMPSHRIKARQDQCCLTFTHLIQYS